MNIEFGKAFYVVTDPLPSWSIQPDELAKCSVCGDSLTFVYPGRELSQIEGRKPQASDYMIPNGIRCHCFIEKWFDGFARHHTLNREPVPITPLITSPSVTEILPDKKNARYKRQLDRAKPETNKRNAKIARKIRERKRN